MNYPDFSAFTVLIVDDMASSRTAAATLLKKAGAKVDYARDGREALEAFRRETDSYSLILMDIKMPVMNGLEATKKIKEIKADIPVIAIIGGVTQETLDSAYEAGMQDYIIKPLSEEDKFFETVSKYLGK